MSRNTLPMSAVYQIADFITGTDNPHKHPMLTEDALIDKYEIEILAFADMISKLFDMIVLDVTNNSTEPVLGFAGDKGIICSKNILPEFILGILLYMSDNGDLPKDKQAFSRHISLGGKVTYELTLSELKK